MNALHKKRLLHLFLSIIALVVFIGILFYFTELLKENTAVKNILATYGYPGIFVLSLIGGFNLAVPIPIIAFLPLFLQSGLNFWVTIIIITLGLTIADVIGYFIGRVSFDIAAQTAQTKVLERLVRLRERYRWGPFLGLFLFACFAPMPNEVIVIPMGFLGYRLYTIFPLLFLGNFIFNLLYSAGILSIFQLG